MPPRANNHSGARKVRRRRVSDGVAEGESEGSMARRMISPFLRGAQASKRPGLDLAGAKMAPCEIQRRLRVETLAGEKHCGEEALPAPDVQRNAGIDQRNEGIEALVVVLSGASWRMDDWCAVGAQPEM